MNRRNALGALLALLVLAAPMMAASPVLASQTVQFDGDAADASDQTDTTYLATNSDLDNFTIQMTEDQSISSSGSLVLNTTYEATSATIESSSGSGTLSATVYEGNVTVTETGGSSSATLETLNVTFNVTDNSSAAGVDVSSAMPNGTEVLMEDDDASEQHNYQVYDPAEVIDVSYEVVGAELEFNESANDLEANGSDATGQFVFHLTRNNSTYENIPVSTLQFDVGFNTTYFSDINEETNLSTDTIVLTDIYTENGEKHYTLDVQKPANTSSEYWEDITVRINATAESGDVNETLVHSSIQNPDGGVQSEGATRYDHAAPAGIVSPNFTEIGDLPTWAFVIGVAIIVAAIVGFWYYQSQGMAMRGYGVSEEMDAENILVMLLALGTVVTIVDALFGGPLGIAALFTGLGIPVAGIVVIGAVVLGGVLYLNASRSEVMG